MTLEELIRRFRTLAVDKVQPYLFDDEDVIDWLNDAQRQACIRGRLLREDANPAVCEIALTPGQRTYPLHKSVYEIINARIVPGNGDRARTVFLASREWMDGNMPDWRDEQGQAEFAIQDDTSIRVVGVITTGDKLVIECYRTPLKVLANDVDKPEIHEAHHEHLIQWALHKAFSVVDADTFDPQRSDRSEAAFTNYFGRMPDSDLRRMTREDVPHHNAPILP